MTKHTEWQLGRRERQIMDIVFKLGHASVAQVQSELPDPPSYSAVRAMLGFLEDKGYLRHEHDGIKYVYFPTANRRKARAAAPRQNVLCWIGNRRGCGIDGIARFGTVAQRKTAHAPGD